LLAFVGLVALAPLVCERARGPLRRFFQGAMAVLLATLVAGLRGSPLPYDGTESPLGLGIDRSESVAAVTGAVWGALADHPILAIEALIVGAVAAALPPVRRFGLWGVCGLGALYAAASILVPTLAGAGDVASLPILLSIWAIVAIGALPALRETLRAERATPVE
jgi:hypothetical protein